MLRLVPALVVLVACGVTEGNIDEKLAKAQCSKLVECADLEDEKACVASETETFAGTTRANQDAGCVLDEDAAQDCVDGMRDATCDTYNDALSDLCRGLWDCPNP